MLLFISEKVIGAVSTVGWLAHTPPTMADGGGFSGDALVRIRNRGYCPVRKLCAGDEVYADTKRRARVECVVRFEFEPDVLFGKTGVAAWQPVRPFARRGFAEKWSLPAHVSAERRPRPPHIMYNLVLSAHHTIMLYYEDHDVFGAEFLATTLGHGIRGDAVASHPYFGCMWTVTRDLERMPGWDRRRVVVPACAYDRDSSSGEVLRVSPAVLDVDPEPEEHARQCFQRLFMEYSSTLCRRSP